MSRLTLLGSLLVVVAGSSIPGRGAEVRLDKAQWPQFRGPNRDDHSPDTGLLKKWPAGGPALVWKTTGLGIGFSSVSVSSGKIFTMGDQSESSFVYALDQASGNKLWETKV